ncbi:hypothetical protein [Pseudoalteromonas sp. TB64]|uniref:hypothetical protein n=1 Tax=Pseudoalteromonas sp. TB64 TaxID=1938600 RepID=UPI00046447C0|nr:hypothetical protein [Pseudoalteromonas sp. TB64]
MISRRANDVWVNLELMNKEFKTILEKVIFLEWFLSALDKADIINQMRHIEVCSICNENYFLLHEENKVISKYEYRIPNGATNLIVNSSILHLVSMHSLVPELSVISALENLYCKAPKL